MNKFSEIKSTGSYVPEKIRTNKYFEELLGTDVNNGGTTDEWIMKRVGIKERRITQHPYETHEYMSIKAIEKALEKVKINHNETAVFLATNTYRLDLEQVPCKASGNNNMMPAFDILADRYGGAMTAYESLKKIVNGEVTILGGDKTTPSDSRGTIFWHNEKSLAQKVAEHFDMKDENSFDITTGCASYLFALALADMYVKTTNNNAVIVGVDKMLDATNPKDRASIILFGEMASATILTPSNNSRFVYHELHTDGTQRDLIRFKKNNGNVYFEQDGRAVYDWAIKVMNETLQTAQSIFPDNNPVIIAHQANPRLLQFIQKKTKGKIIITGDTFGNCSTASVPHALDVAYQKDLIKQETTIYFVQFGAGLSWALNVYKQK